jgi:hypothetical protein
MTNDDTLATVLIIGVLVLLVIALRLAWREMHRPDVDPNTLAPHDRLVDEQLERGHDDVNGHS